MPEDWSYYEGMDEEVEAAYESNSEPASEGEETD